MSEPFIEKHAYIGLSCKLGRHALKYVDLAFRVLQDEYNHKKMHLHFMFFFLQFLQFFQLHFMLSHVSDVTDCIVMITICLL